MAAFALRPYTPRQQMMLPGSPLDRRIAFLKRAFPATAAGLLVLVLGLTFAQTNELSFMVSRERVQPANERIRAENSVYRGVDETGRPFTVRAGSAVQRSAAVAEIELQTLSATIALETGAATVTAPAGRFALDQSVLTVSGPVDARQAGFQVTGGIVAVDLARGTAASDRPVVGSIPIGSFRAGGLRSDLRTQSLTLIGGVRLRVPAGMGS